MYNIIKTIAGQRNGQVLDTYETIDEAREELIRQMSYIDRGYDDSFIANEAAKQAEIDFAKESAADENTIDNITAWVSPCIIDRNTMREVCNATCDMFSYDNYTVSIEDTEE